MKKRRNPPPQREPVDTGTEQTVKKLRSDVILKLYEAGQIGKAHLAAADQIRDIHQAIGSALFPFGKMDGAGAPKYRGAPLSPLEKMTTEQYRNWQRFYIPWTKQLEPEILAMTFAVVIDNWGTDQLESWLGIRAAHATVTPLVRDALRQYAELAGLVTKRAA